LLLRFGFVCPITYVGDVYACAFGILLRLLCTSTPIDDVGSKNNYGPDIKNQSAYTCTCVKHNASRRVPRLRSSLVRITSGHSLNIAHV